MISMKRRIVTLVILILIAAVSGYFALNQLPDAGSDHNPSVTDTKIVTPEPAPAKSTVTKFNVSQHSLDDAASPWVVVNKKRPLKPKDYAPSDLTVPVIQLRSNITSEERQVRAVTAEALKKLAEAAQTDGITLTLQSGYRSYDFQANLYARYVGQQGQTVADTQSARAGHSEHQTGLAADVGGVTRPACNVEACFAGTPEGIWVAANAHKYGFTIRYPEGKMSITGYTYEPWHLRYVGKELADEMHAKGIQTLEEFFRLPAAPDYN